MIDLGFSLGVRVPQGDAKRLGLVREGIHAYLPETREALAFLEAWRTSPLLLSHERDAVRRKAELLRGRLDYEPDSGAFTRPVKAPVKEVKRPRMPGLPYDRHGYFTGNPEAARYYGRIAGQASWGKMTPEQRRAKIQQMVAARKAKRKPRHET